MDKGALDGLRGFFAFHLMVFHALLYFKPPSSEPTINVYAAVHMPFFFLLSGFCLTLSNGKTQWNGSNRGCYGCKTTTSNGVDKCETQNPEPKIFDSWEFYKKRLIRVLPLHYFAIIAAAIAKSYG